MEEKTIRFLKNHAETVGKRQVRFQKDDTVPVGGAHEISEELGRELIRRGVAVPGDCYGAAIAFQFKGGTKDD
jgi:hypothetical protein